MDVRIKAMKEGEYIDFKNDLNYSQIVAENWWTNIKSVWRKRGLF
jgi:hypothetical protein